MWTHSEAEIVRVEVDFVGLLIEEKKVDSLVGSLVVEELSLFVGCDREWM